MSKIAVAPAHHNNMVHTHGTYIQYMLLELSHHRTDPRFIFSWSCFVVGLYHTLPQATMIQNMMSTPAANVTNGSKPYIVEDRPMISRSSGDRG